MSENSNKYIVKKTFHDKNTYVTHLAGTEVEYNKTRAAELIKGGYIEKIKPDKKEPETKAEPASN